MTAKTFKIENEQLSNEIVNLVIEVLENGGIIVYPTETAYGIGCDVFNENAVKRIYQLKKRAEDQPLPVIVSSLDMAERIAVLTPEIIDLSNKFHPGSLVIAAQKRDLIPKIVNPLGIAFRISSNKIIHQLVSCFNKPIISTSANLSGNSAPYSISNIKSQLDFDLIDIILDSGELPKRKPSTIVDFQLSPSPQIIREGEITAEEILDTLEIKKDKWKYHLLNKLTS
ncbi:MAG: threonylcarbamoyl-AMP synthase [Asgard group archaeon]|nr:threonylcarbamoyl-AMP synthase [Asgard group archaeon]